MTLSRVPLLILTLFLILCSGCAKTVDVHTIAPEKVEDLFRFRVNGKYGMRAGFMVKYDYNIKTAEVKIRDLYFIQDEDDRLNNYIWVFPKEDIDDLMAVFKKNKEIVDSGGEWVTDYRGFHGFKRDKYPVSYGGMPRSIYDLLEPAFSAPVGFRLTSPYVYLDPFNFNPQIAIATGEYIESQAVQDMLERGKYVKASKFIPYFSHPGGSRLLVEPLRRYIEEQLASGVKPEDIDWAAVKSDYGAFNAAVFTLGNSYVDYAQKKKILNRGLRFEAALYTPVAAGSAIYYMHKYDRGKGINDFMKMYLPYLFKEYAPNDVVGMLKTFAYRKYGKSYRDRVRKAATKYYTDTMNPGGINALQTYFAKTLKHYKTTRYIAFIGATGMAAKGDMNKSLAIISHYAKLRGKKAGSGLVVSVDAALKKRGKRKTAKRFMAAYTRSSGDRSAETAMLHNRDKNMVRERYGEAVTKSLTTLESYYGKPERKQNYEKLLNEIIKQHASGKEHHGEWVVGLSNHYLKHDKQDEAVALWMGYFEDTIYFASKDVDSFFKQAPPETVTTFMRQLFATYRSKRYENRELRPVYEKATLPVEFQAEIAINALNSGDWWAMENRKVLKAFIAENKTDKAVAFLKKLYDVKPAYAEGIFEKYQGTFPPALFRQVAQQIAQEDAANLKRLSAREQIVFSSLQPSAFKDRVVEKLFSSITPFNSDFYKWSALLKVLDCYRQGGGSETLLFSKLGLIYEEMGKRGEYKSIYENFDPVCAAFPAGKKFLTKEAKKQYGKKTLSGLLMAVALNPTKQYKDTLRDTFSFEASMGSGSSRVDSSGSQRAFLLMSAKGKGGKATLHSKITKSANGPVRFDIPLFVALKYDISYRTRIKAVGKNEEKSHYDSEYEIYKLTDANPVAMDSVSFDYSLAKKANVLVFFTYEESLVDDPECSVEVANVNGLPLSVASSDMTVEGATSTARDVKNEWEAEYAPPAAGGGTDGMAQLKRFFYLLPVSDGFLNYAESGNCMAFDGARNDLCRKIHSSIDYESLPGQGVMRYTGPYQTKDCYNMTSFVDRSACEGILPYADDKQVMKIWSTLAAEGWLIDLKRNKIIQTR